MHSAKDVPGELPDGLAIVGVPERADARDALCGAESLEDLPPARWWAPPACAGRRRCSRCGPTSRSRELRGNVDTRLRRLADGDYDAIVLAQAGLERLGRGDEGAPLDPDRSCPRRDRAAWRSRRARTTARWRPRPRR